VVRCHVSPVPVEPWPPAGRARAIDPQGGAQLREVAGAPSADWSLAAPASAPRAGNDRYRAGEFRAVPASVIRPVHSHRAHGRRTGRSFRPLARRPRRRRSADQHLAHAAIGGLTRTTPPQRPLGCTLNSAATPSRNATPTRPVRGCPWKSGRCAPTAQTVRNAVRYTSVDPATQRSTARQGDTQRDREETARNFRVHHDAISPFPRQSTPFRLEIANSRANFRTIRHSPT
jgi:hypothetical protein